MDFRQFIELLDAKDELIRIDAEVDPEYELGALLQQAEEQGKACWFEHVKGADFPAVGGVMAGPERHALSIGHAPDEFTTLDDYGHLLNAALDAPIEPSVSDSGPVSEVVLTGDKIDLTRLPIPKFFEGDSHRFITAGVGFAMDPGSGIQNVGYYRAPIIDSTHFSAGASPKSNLTRIYQNARERGGSIPIAMVIAPPPAILLTAGARMPSEKSDVAVAGALQGSPINLAKCQTSDLLVPAEAEIVIEAVVDFDQDITHSMGEYGDQYGTTISPLAKVTAITHRTNAVFHTILGGMNREHNALGIIMFGDLREELLERVRKNHPNVVDIYVDFTPRHAGLRAQINIAIEKSNDEQPQRIIDEVFAMSSGNFPMQMIVQRIVIVDPDVNISNLEDIQWAIACRMDRADKLRVYENITPRGVSTARLGVDATMQLDKQSTMKRPIIPSAAHYRLADYK